MFGYQGMICLAGNQVWWTWEVEDVFNKVKKGAKTALKDYAKRQHKQINEVVGIVRTKLEKNDRSKFNAVLIIDVHARDIIDGFVRDRYNSCTSICTLYLKRLIPQNKIYEYQKFRCFVKKTKVKF